jgi:cysteine desulfurase
MIAYLDNAATTPVAPEVIETMLPYLQQHYGNPSSPHSLGRQAKAAIERARKTIAQLVGASPLEIYFTSGGTEADNTALCGFVSSYGISTVISSPLEHHAVLHTLQHMHQSGQIKLELVQHNQAGMIDLSHLTELLEEHPKALVSIMHANNEIGNINPIAHIGELCQQKGAYFHTDAVQTIGHLPVNLKETVVHSLAASAHKFNGPKGVGFMYVKKANPISCYISGGAQERNQRGGTENVAGIVGMAKALELAAEHMEADTELLNELKAQMIQRLKEELPGVRFNGASADIASSLPTILSVSLPIADPTNTLLFNLDLAGVCCSGGSACSSGAAAGSHVMSALKQETGRSTIRFSFSRFTTAEEVHFAIDELLKVMSQQGVKENV